MLDCRRRKTFRMVEQLTFALLKELYAAWDYAPAKAEATLRVDSAEISHALSVAIADENLSDSGLQILEGDPTKPLIGQLFQFHVGAPRLSLGTFAPSLDVLLKRPRARMVEPANYFLVNAARQDVAELLARYRSALSFVNLLGESAAYLDIEQAQLVFIKDGKFVVPVEYRVNDLTSLDISSMTRLLEAFGQDLHRDQKLAILAEEVIGLTLLHPPATRFSALLSSLEKLADRFFAGYKLFASSFSYQKIRNEIEEAGLEYTGKIHKVLTDIQSQLLTIPVATVIVATQLRETSTFNGQFWSNCAVLLGAVIFAVLLSLMIRNQKTTLSVTAKEIDRQRRTMRNQFPDAVATFDDVFSALDVRITGQYSTLRVVRILLWLGLISAIVAFFILTRPATAALHWLCVTLCGFFDD